MLFKTIKTRKLGNLHYLKIKRILKQPNKKFRKEDVQLVMTGKDLKELYEHLHLIFDGAEEHFLAVPVEDIKVPKIEIPKEDNDLMFGMI